MGRDQDLGIGWNLSINYFGEAVLRYSTPTPPPDLTATEPNAFLVASNFIQNMALMR
jgi:hypothetical protein